MGSLLFRGLGFRGLGFWREGVISLACNLGKDYRIPAVCNVEYQPFCACFFAVFGPIVQLFCRGCIGVACSM